MKIIPAIDIINGQCVRLSEGDFTTSKVYYTDPLEAAVQFEAAGLEALHLVDLDGARQRRVANWDVLERIASGTSLRVDFSGGISSARDVEKALGCGAAQVAVGSLAARDPHMVDQWLQHFGSDRIIIGADVREGYIATHGWQETSAWEIIEFISRYRESGGKFFLCTDVSRDGLLAGPAVDLYQAVLEAVEDIHLVASGGVASLADLEALREAGCGSAIVGKAIYEKRITLRELSLFNTTCN
jgi:phosphoribosylformimino-5-aminoimidazole carboxamide ribotide isomerase